LSAHNALRISTEFISKTSSENASVSLQASTPILRMDCAESGAKGANGMRSGKLGFRVLRILPILLCGGVIALFCWRPVEAQQQIHRDGFEGKKTAWIRGEDNVRAEQKAHTISSDFAHLGTQSEFIQLVCPEGKNDPNQANYYYPTQPAPIAEDLVASVWVKASRAGVQLQARLVLPKERNPKQLDEPMTVILTGDKYQLTRRWQRLEMQNPVKLVKDQQQLLRAQLRRDVDLTDAYIDRLILNLYTGAGQIDVYIDDLEIGPVRPIAPPKTKDVAKAKDGTPVTNPKKEVRPERGYPVHMEQDKLFVDNKPFFFRAIRYTNTPLKTLRDAGFNAVWFDAYAPVEKIEEAISHGFWIVPNLPLLGDNSLPPNKGTPSALTSARDVEGYAAAINRFSSVDAVLFWDLGGALQVEKEESLKLTVEAIEKSPALKRPHGADVWDGFSTLSHHLQMIGTHRYPLLTSLELTKYRDWLQQRRRLANVNALHWTWIQTHVPEWQTQIIYGRKSGEGFSEPIGPQPEQIRLLTYIGLATGCRGLAFSSDRFLADSHQGRDRLLMMALLNQEIHMLEPLLLTLRETPTWIDTSNPHVKAAVLRCEKGLLVLPIWLGDGAQCVPPQGALSNLSIVVPLVPDGTQPWEISPGRVQSLQYLSERRLSGMRIVLTEFDLTSAIVFTSDLPGMVVKWQNHARLMAPQVAQWARDLAAAQLDKVRRTHEELADLAPPVRNADELLQQAEQRLETARKHEKTKDYQNAYLEALRALRPLRILMRSHWEQAVRTLDVPSASPFAVTFYTLPQHWRLHVQLNGTKLGANALRDGDFEAATRLPNFVAAANARSGKDIGAPASSLPAWTVQQQTLDAVELEARLIPAAIAKVERPEKAPKKKGRYDPSTGASTDPPEPPVPDLGECVLKLEVRPKVIVTQRDNKPLPAPAALERTYLAVNSPVVRLQPDTWVRISGWVRIPNPISASADGVLFFDSACGEGMGLRMTGASDWKKFHLYRKVPASGTIWLTAALTGIGTVYFDDLKIEPLTK
jgi:hypothetical protein